MNISKYESEDDQGHEERIEKMKRAQANEKVRLKAFDLEKKLRSRRPLPVAMSRQVHQVPRNMFVMVGTAYINMLRRKEIIDELI